MALRLSGDWVIGITFLTDKAIQALNKRYLKHNCPTDVIAFNYGNASADIAISYETAQRNSRTYKSSVTRELILYILHGMMHLAGYDDCRTADKKKMFAKQERIFKGLF